MAALLAAASIGGCATAAVEDAWSTAPVDDHRQTTVAAPESRTAAARPPPKRPSTLRAQASRYRTPNQCVTAARGALADGPKRGLSFLYACSLRPDFDVLNPLLRTPWLPLLKGNLGLAYNVFVHAMAGRQDYDGDVAWLHDAGFDIAPAGLEASVGVVGTRVRDDNAPTPVVGVEIRGRGPVYVEELAPPKIKYRRRGSAYTAVTREGYVVTGHARLNSLEDLQPTGMHLKLSRSPRCTGPSDKPRLYLVKLGPPVANDRDTGPVYEAEVMACAGLGRR